MVDKKIFSLRLDVQNVSQQAFFGIELSIAAEFRESFPTSYCSASPGGRFSRSTIVFLLGMIAICVAAAEPTNW